MLVEGGETELCVGNGMGRRGGGGGGRRTSDQEMGGGLRVVASEAARSSRAPEVQNEAGSEVRTAKYVTSLSALLRCHPKPLRKPPPSSLSATAHGGSPSPILWSQLS